MIKFTKLLGIFNLFLDVILVSLLMSYFFKQGGSTSEALGLALAGISFAIIAFVLSIPMAIFLIKYKLYRIRFYFYSHVLLFILSFLLLTIVMLNR